MTSRPRTLDERVTVTAGPRRRWRVELGSTIRITDGIRTWSIMLYVGGAIVARRPPLGWSFEYGRRPVRRIDRWKRRTNVLVLSLHVPEHVELSVTRHAPRKAGA